jgi:GT2 family glycosyltransferase
MLIKPNPRRVSTLPASIREAVAAGSGPASRLGVDGKFFARGAERFRMCGVTYGPFAENAAGQPFPEPARIATDLEQMQHAGINAIRVYDAPSPPLLAAADQAGMGLLVDVPWSKHVCFLSSTAATREARAAVRQAVRRTADACCVLAYSVGNEIPADIVRWQGARRVERFLAELADVARQAAPTKPVTYVNYPPTEYLDLSYLDFATFNVYLHDREAFRRYLLRLQNLVGEKPLVLGEIGMDTLRHGEAEQARFLGGHARQAMLSGVAGLFVFAWSDEWHTGGHAVHDWAFGITDRARTPRASYHALREVYRQPPSRLLARTPRVSVIVCAYNSAATLEECLASLEALDYPDYEVLVVDDGSFDATAEIIARHPAVRAIAQPNLGLAEARNVGLRAATGSIVAYTDADCRADAEWLTHLVAQLESCDAAAVGGPNLAPDDGPIAACVAAAPGQPMHVLESDQVAEHVPGCNMAFRREALEWINGFDPQFRRAGDDVDICWRLQQAGFWISFAPSAVVWHHRRPTLRTYLAQQAGYGEAEALLRFKHPEQFNGRGHGKWRGMIYGDSLRGLVLDQALIYRGTFATGLFQCIYQPGPAHWAMLPTTLEWHALAATVALAGIGWRWLWLLAAAMLLLSAVVAALQAAQARLAAGRWSTCARALVAGLCYLQPLVRSWARYRTRYFSFHPDTRKLNHPRGPVRLLQRVRTVSYWGAATPERTHLLQRLLRFLDALRCGTTIDSGWSDCDLEVFRDPWTAVRICTVQEEHGSGRRVIRVRYELRLTSLARVATTAALATGGAMAWFHPLATALCIGSWGAVLGAAWWKGAHLSARLAEIVDQLAAEMDLISLQPAPQEATPKPPPASTEDR